MEGLVNILFRPRGRKFLDDYDLPPRVLRRMQQRRRMMRWAKAIPGPESREIREIGEPEKRENVQTPPDPGRILRLRYGLCPLAVETAAEKEGVRITISLHIIFTHINCDTRGGIR